MRLHLALASVLVLSVPSVHAAQNCSGNLTQAPLPVRATVLEPVSSDFTPLVSQLGAPSGVLSQPLDETYSVERVLMRLRIEGCRDVAKAMPASGTVVANANDPAAYKPKTEFDNTPWRFDMTQGGKRMTADEFDAWMKSRGVRVVQAKPAAPAAEAPAAPAATEEKKK